MILDKRLFILVSLLVLYSCYNPPNETIIDGQTMGTTYSVIIIDYIDMSRPRPDSGFVHS